MKEEFSSVNGAGTGIAPRLTRRQTLPVLAGILGAGLAASRSAEAEPAGIADGAQVFNVRSYGAKGDGKTLDTAAVQRAIDACSSAGGGIVLVPAGSFLIGTVEMKSNVTLHIAASGVLLGSTRGTDYHAVDATPLTGDTTLEDGNWALIYAENAKNITVEGAGTINGQGSYFHAPARGELAPSGLRGHQRPYHMLFYRCENLRVRNIDLIASAYHSVRVIESQRATMDGIYIYNRVNGNNDGFHFISCQYVMVSNCTVLSGDDACALFGSCQYVTVTNSSFSTRWSCFRFGGGIARDVTVSNCVLHQVFGCPIKFQGVPGSLFENMSFANLVLDEVTGPISISIGPREMHGGHPGPSEAVAQTPEPPAAVRNISFSNIHGTVTTNPPQLPGYPFRSGYRPGELHSCIVLNCAGDATMEKIAFENIHLIFGGGGTAEDAGRSNLPQIAGEYFVLGPMPAYGLYARNARGITLSNIRFEVEAPDLRPAVILHNVEDAVITGCTAQGNGEADSVFRFTDTRQILVSSPRVLGQAAVFLRVEGATCEDIIVDGGDLMRAKQALDLGDGVAKGAVRLRGQ